MICISCWSHGNRLDFIVALLWSRQALIHFSFTLLAKHIMWIWSFVPDRPRLTSLSPQAPDASQRSRGGGEEFHWIQRLLHVSFDSSVCLAFPCSSCWPVPRDPLPNHLPGPRGQCLYVHRRTRYMGTWRCYGLLVKANFSSGFLCMSKPVILWMRRMNLAWFIGHFSSVLVRLLTEL